MLSSLRTKLLLITTLSVIVALSLTGAITYILLRASVTQTAAQQLSAARSGLPEATISTPSFPSSAAQQQQQ